MIALSFSKSNSNSSTPFDNINCDVEVPYEETKKGESNNIFYFFCELIVFTMHEFLFLNHI